MNIQHQFNAIKNQPANLDAILVPETYAEYKQRWLYRSKQVLSETVRLISMRSLASHDETFDECIQAIANPSLPVMDFLAYCMMPHSQLRPLVTFMTGFNSWNLPLYVVECMTTFVPIELVGSWISVRLGGNRWRKGEDGLSFYVPNELDYAFVLPPEAHSESITLPIGSKPITLTLPEYIDRIFLGVGGLWSNVRMSISGQTGLGKLLYKYNLRQGGEVSEDRLLPPINSIAMNYLTALTHGTIMPFHYKTILGDHFYGRLNSDHRTH